jgi:NADPH:quinone reductase-like Zn-dependent oxidoreductase
LSFEEAASVPLGALNALHFLRNAQIKEGERVLINGAGGSIGLFGVQIAKSMGAQVTAVDSPLKEPAVRRAGADHFIDYTKGAMDSGGTRYDVVFDMVAGSSYSTCVGLLAPGGRYLIGNPRLSKMLRSVFTSRFSDKTVSFAFADESVADLVTLREMCERGELKPQLDRVFPREQIQLAHELVETEQRQGAIVLSHHFSKV